MESTPKALAKSGVSFATGKVIPFSAAYCASTSSVSSGSQERAMTSTRS